MTPALQLAPWLLALSALGWIVTPRPEEAPNSFALGLVLTLVSSITAGFVLALRPALFKRVGISLGILGGLTLGLMAAWGAQFWDFRLFQLGQSERLGVPLELSLCLLGAAYLNPQAAWREGARRLGLAAGLLAFFALDMRNASFSFNLGEAFKTGFVHSLAALLLLAVWGLALVDSWRSFAWLPKTLPALALGALTLPALASEHPLLALTSVATLGAIAIVLSQLIHTSWELPRPLLWEWTVLAIIVGLWALLKSYAIVPSRTDESIYFYMIERIVEHGEMPYRDFFFAHPPLHLLVPAFFASIFGPELWLLKWSSALANLLAGLAIYWGVRPRLGPWASLLGLILALFAAEALKASSNLTGVNLSTMWLCIGVAMALRQHRILAGLALSFAVASGMYTAGPALATCTLALFAPTLAAQSWRRWLDRITPFAVFALSCFALHSYFYSIGGEGYLDGVFRYHTLKEAQLSSRMDLVGGAWPFPLSWFYNIGLLFMNGTFVQEVYYHPHLWMGGALALATSFALLVRQADPQTSRWARLSPERLFTSGQDGIALYISILALALFAQYALFQELYSFYFALIYPFLGFATGWLLVRAYRVFLNVHASRTALSVAALLLFVLHSERALSHLLTANVFKGERKDVGKVSQYEPLSVSSPWRDALVNAFFWKDSRVKGNVDRGFRYFLWSKGHIPHPLLEATEYVRSRAKPGDTLSGASTSASYVAYATGVPMADNQIDTNTKRFKAKLMDEKEFWKRICADNMRFIISTERSFFTEKKLKNHRVTKKFFGPPKRFTGYSNIKSSKITIDVYERTTDTPCSY